MTLGFHHHIEIRRFLRHPQESQPAVLCFFIFLTVIVHPRTDIISQQSFFRRFVAIILNHRPQNAVVLNGLVGFKLIELRQQIVIHPVVIIKAVQRCGDTPKGRRYRRRIQILLIEQAVDVYQLRIVRPTTATLAKDQGADNEKKNGYRI